MAEKEHTGIIDLSKSKSILDEIIIEYKDRTNYEKLTVEIDVFINNKHVGHIDKYDGKYTPFRFVSQIPVLNDIIDKTIKDVKKRIETTLTTTINYIKEWH